MELTPERKQQIEEEEKQRADNGPIELATLDLTPILANPELARAAQEIALQLAEAEAAQIDTDYRPQPKLLEAEYTD